MPAAKKTAAKKTTAKKTVAKKTTAKKTAAKKTAAPDLATRVRDQVALNVRNGTNKHTANRFLTDLGLEPLPTQTEISVQLHILCPPGTTLSQTQVRQGIRTALASIGEVTIEPYGLSVSQR